MHNIGDAPEAEFILAWVRGCDTEYGRPTVVESEDAPEGWEFVATGSFRSVWRSPSGVAYKVCHAAYDRQSSSEIANLKEAWERGVPDGCRLPRFNAFRVGDDEIVVAVELINGETLYSYDQSHSREATRHLYDLLRKIEDTFRLCDMHDENALVDENGLLVPVDFGA